MATKRPPSTADKLGMFREQVARHYKSLRSDKCRPYPMPSIDQFPVFHQSMAKTIMAEEKAKHDESVNRNAAMKESNG